MKKFLAHSIFVLALGAFAAAQTTPTTTPSNTNNTGTQNPTQAQPVPNPNAPPAPDANVNPSANQTGTATSTGSANPQSTTKSGDADQTTTTTPPATTATQDQSTTTTTTTSTQTDTRASKSAKNETVVGCLESTSNRNFTIRTSKNDVAVIPSSTFTGNFADHVGHKVRMHGAYVSTETAMNSEPSKLPQSDQPATGKSETNSPTKEATVPDTRAEGTAADANANTASRQFRADSIDMLAKTCGNNNYNKK